MTSFPSPGTDEQVLFVTYKPSTNEQGFYGMFSIDKVKPSTDNPIFSGFENAFLDKS